ncbi:hypothetical protein M758_5G015600 [Ceratodon purpureus]|nr:hypothetical protein M758_5G015600 [Ceratodon purpureus]
MNPQTSSFVPPLVPSPSLSLSFLSFLVSLLVSLLSCPSVGLRLLSFCALLSLSVCLVCSFGYPDSNKHSSKLTTQRHERRAIHG